MKKDLDASPMSHAARYSGSGLYSAERRQIVDHYEMGRAPRTPTLDELDGNNQEMELEAFDRGLPENFDDAPEEGTKHRDHAKSSRQGGVREL